MAEKIIRAGIEINLTDKAALSQETPSASELQHRFITSTKAQLVCAAMVFVFAITLYAFTLAPTVTLVDSGELIATAYTLGVAHPPGFPLYTLLAHFATLIPMGNIAERVNFLSALSGALASAMIVLFVSEVLISIARGSRLMPRARKRERRAKKTKKQEPKSTIEINIFQSIPPVMLLAPGLMAGLLFACSRTLWAYATITEVYTLNTLLTVTIFYLMMRWRRGVLEPQSNSGRNEQGSQEKRDRLLFGAAFVFGLALGVHHVTIGLMLPAVAFLAYRTEGVKIFISRKLLKAALFAFAGLAIYIYLPLAASRSPLMNWGDPATAERLWWHVTGRQYQVFLSFSLDTMIGQFDEFLTFAGREFGWWWMPLAAALSLCGFAFLYKSERTIFWFLIGVIICDLAYALNYDIAEDKDAYYLPVFVALATAAGAGATWLIRLFYSTRMSQSMAFALVAALVVAAPGVSLAGNLSYNNRSQYYIAEDYATNMFDSMEQGGMLLTPDWQVYSPMLYLLDVEKRRPDLIIVDVNQLRRSWYFDYLKKVYPELIERTSDKVEAFLEDLRAWESAPAAFDRDTARTQRINTRFYDMILAFVSNQLEQAPVYVTEEMIVSTAHRDGELTKALTSAYRPVPRGLIFQLTRDGFSNEPSEVQLKTRGLVDGTLRFEKDDVVRLKVIPVYVRMAANRGIYLAATGRHHQAIEQFHQALALDPENIQAQKLIAESQKRLQGMDAEKPK